MTHKSRAKPRAVCVRRLANLRHLAALVFLLILGAPAAGQTAGEFSCDVFGSGYTPHPDFAYTCCFPGAQPVPGEARCSSDGAPGTASQPGGNAAAPGQSSGAPGGHCIPLGLSCTLHGAPCCSGTCQGPFPNTMCQ